MISTTVDANVLRYLGCFSYFECNISTSCLKSNMFYVRFELFIAKMRNCMHQDLRSTTHISHEVYAYLSGWSRDQCIGAISDGQLVPWLAYPTSARPTRYQTSRIIANVVDDRSTLTVTGDRTPRYLLLARLSYLPSPAPAEAEQIVVNSEACLTFLLRDISREIYGKVKDDLSQYLAVSQKLRCHGTLSTVMFVNKHENKNKIKLQYHSYQY